MHNSVCVCASVSSLIFWGEQKVQTAPDTCLCFATGDGWGFFFCFLFVLAAAACSVTTATIKSTKLELITTCFTHI